MESNGYLWDKKQELHIIRQMYSHTDKLNPYTGEDELNENDEKKEYDNLLDKEAEAIKTAESKLENLQTKVAAGNKKSAIKKTTTTKRKTA